jgi:two-component system, NtrC family, sensor histidine kinase PilS
VLISYTCGGVSSGMANLLIVPVASGSLLFRSRLSTFFAAVGSILAIYSEVYLYLIIDEGIVYFVQAGLLGLTLFAVSWSLQYLGGKIRQNELFAQQQAKNIQSLQEMNDQIIQRMHAGIVVVNHEGIILNINDSAKKFLANSDRPQQEATKIPETLFKQLQNWQHDNLLKTYQFKVQSSAPELQATFAYLTPDKNSNILIFLEDYTVLTSKAQQLKLISLGRLTASIAHEVRNPLGAISHASQLLGESNTIIESDQRLLEIIDTHAMRVNQIIENILDLSRNKNESPDIINLYEWLQQFINKFSNSQADPVTIDFDVEPKDIQVRFNQSQLEQLLTNLCENGLRYSRKSTGKDHLSISAKLNPVNKNIIMDIIDDGKGIAEEHLMQMFEPFFTTETSGTGLGLFICKEICESNQAQLSYLRVDGNKSCFRIHFPASDKFIV